MKNKRLSFDEFIGTDITITNKETILEFHESKAKKIFAVARDMIIWSVFGVTLDVLIISGSTVTTLVDGLGLVTWLPTLLFLILNYIAKAIYIKYKIRDASLSLMVKGVVQYVGSILIIDHVFRHHTEYRDAVKKYFDYLKERNKKFFKILNIIKKIVIAVLVIYALWYLWIYFK